MVPLKVGLKASVETKVSPEETAQRLKTGDVPVWATPALARLMEEACVAALAGCLPEGQTSVGSYLEVRHLAPTPVGLKVRAEAELTGIEGRRLTFRLQAFDEVEEVGEGEHLRVLVDVERFRETCRRKLSPQPQ